MKTPIHRWTEFSFPAYTYVPGKTPHPRRETAGHSYGHVEPIVESFDPQCCIECPEFLLGIDLFNAGFYWESHEQWEAVWHAANRVGPVADFLKGLIKLSAAGVKALEGRPIGVVRHLQRAAELFAIAEHVATGDKTAKRMCGLDVSQLSQASTDMVRAIESAGDQEAHCLAVFKVFRLKLDFSQDLAD